jgi:hypothetical protein
LISFLKRIWRKLFGVKTGAYSSDKALVEEYWHRDGTRKIRVEGGEWINLNRKAYDPSEDQHKVMTGEMESYFD